jgi:predicted nucleotidyltransferase
MSTSVQHKRFERLVGVTDRELCLKGEILRGEVGSGLHGTGLPGKEDRDEMGVVIEPPDRVLGNKQFEHYIYRDQPEGVKAEPGDLEQTWYSLRKFMKLATQGNPSILVLLYCPDSHIVARTTYGLRLQQLAPQIVSMNAADRFLGYLKSQKERLLGIKQKHTPNRPELIEQFGFDTKYAMHACRLGLQGVELLETGKLIEPISEPNSTLLKDIRAGKHTLEEAIEFIGDAERKLTFLRDNPTLCNVNKEPNYEEINQFLTEAYTTTWVDLYEVI